MISKYRFGFEPLINNRFRRYSKSSLQRAIVSFKKVSQNSISDLFNFEYKRDSQGWFLKFRKFCNRFMLDILRCASTLLKAWVGQMNRVDKFSRQEWRPIAFRNGIFDLFDFNYICKQMVAVAIKQFNLAVGSTESIPIIIRIGPILNSFEAFRDFIEVNFFYSQIQYHWV